MPIGEAALRGVMREVVARNRVRDGIVYIQISRGVARRDHGFPKTPVRPSLTVTAQTIDRRIGEANAARGVAVITLPETRWAHPHIKSLQLLPNVLAKQEAREAGAYEAWFVDSQGMITEGASTNAWIVTADGHLVTRPADDSILRGVTRLTLIEAAREAGYAVEERPFTVQEALEAREAFLTGAGALVMPIVRIDGRPVANGHPGEVARTLRAAYIRRVRASAL